jgi:hypothetical protein
MFGGSPGAKGAEFYLKPGPTADAAGPQPVRPDYCSVHERPVLRSRRQRRRLWSQPADFVSRTRTWGARFAPSLYVAQRAPHAHARSRCQRSSRQATAQAPGHRSADTATRRIHERPAGVTAGAPDAEPSAGLWSPGTGDTEPTWTYLRRPRRGLGIRGGRPPMRAPAHEPAAAASRVESASECCASTRPTTDDGRRGRVDRRKLH